MWAANMSIWVTKIDLNALNEECKNTMPHYLDIEFMEAGDDYLTARMPINQHTHQPIKIMHGGASCVLAETVGSMAANHVIDRKQAYCVGLEINTNHLRAVSEGYVYGIAKPFYIGYSTQVWSIEIVNENKKLVSISRLTVMVLQRTF